MALQELKCPNCGANVYMKEERRTVFCSHCGTQFLVKPEKYTTNHNFHNQLILSNSSLTLKDGASIRIGGGEQTAVNIEEKLKNADTLIGFGEYKKAEKIADVLKEKFPRDYRTWMLWVRIYTKNYTIITDNAHTTPLSRAKAVASPEQLKEIEKEYAAYGKKRAVFDGKRGANTETASPKSGSFTQTQSFGDGNVSVTVKTGGDATAMFDEIMSGFNLGANAGAGQRTATANPAAANPPNKKKKIIGWTVIAAALLALILGLSIGLPNRAPADPPWTGVWYDNPAMKAESERNAKQKAREILLSGTITWHEVSYLEHNYGIYIVFMDVTSRVNGLAVRRQYFACIKYRELDHVGYFYAGHDFAVTASSRNDTEKLNELKTRHSFSNPPAVNR